MDGELVTSSPSEHGKVGGVSRQPTNYRYGTKFEEMCPYYMSIGMTYQEYWDKDCTLAKYFRRADELKRERENTFLWLQGLYIYEAMIDVSPILNAMSKKHKPYPYREAPMPITEAAEKIRKEEENRKRLAKGREAMEIIMANINQKFKKGGASDG